MSSKWRFTLRGDIGGFGVGSDLTWHALTKFTYRQSDSFSWYLGYRAIAYDYEDGQGRNYQNYDLVQHGRARASLSRSDASNTCAGPA